MLGRLQTALQKLKTKRPALVFFAFLVLVGVAFIVHPTLAIDSKPTGEAGWFVSALSWIMLTIANIALQLTIFFLRFFIMLASYNNFIDVDVVQLGWIMVRDLANMFFVIALLVIAFGTILGLEEYEWKKNLVKLILSAIVINFSNLIAQLIIDVAHVFTITFLNAISATAGGNVINMLKLDQVTKLATGDTGSIELELFGASVLAMLFALMAAAAMGSYLVVMMVRVVALWGLIIMSPLAFVLGVLPKTKSYAEKWWSEFSKYVIVAPIMVFFLWLSFATLGLGNIAQQIQNTGISPANKLNQTGFEGQASIALVSSWENMANFFLAFVFMMYGIKATQETGVEGAGAISSAVDFSKSVAKYASGYAAARWAGGKAADLAKTAAKGIGSAAYDLTLANKVEMTGNWFKKQYAGLKDYRNAGPMLKMYKKGDRDVISADRLEKDEEGNLDLSEADKQRGWKLIKNDDGTYQREAQKGLTDFALDKNGQPVFRSWFQKSLYNSQKKLTQSRKALEKVENSAERRQEMIDKSIEAQPDYLLKSGFFGKKEINKDLDRLEMGMLEAMEERSSAKSGQFKAEGREIVLGNKRYKTEGKEGTIRNLVATVVPFAGSLNLESRFQNKNDTIAEQIASHEIAKESKDAQIKNLAAIAKNRMVQRSPRKEKDLINAKLKAELNLKAEDADFHKTEETMLSSIVQNSFGKFSDDMNKLKEIDKKKNQRYEELNKKKQNQLSDAEKAELAELKPGAEERVKQLAELHRKGSLSTEEEAEYARLQAQTDRFAELEARKERQLTQVERDELEKLKIAEKADEKQLSGLMGKKRRNQEEEERVQTLQSRKERLAELRNKDADTFTEAEEREYAGLNGRIAELDEKRATALSQEEKAQMVKLQAAQNRFVSLTAKSSNPELDEDEKLELHVLKDIGKVKEHLSHKKASEYSEEEKKEAAFLKQYDVDVASQALWEKMEKSGNPIARRIAAEKMGHTEGIKVERVEKAIEEAYTRGEHGQHEFEEEAVLHAQIGNSDNVIKQLEAEAKLRVMEGRALHLDHGHGHGGDHEHDDHGHEKKKGPTEAEKAAKLYSDFLKSQAITKIVSDTVSSEEKIKTDSVMEQEMQAGITANTNIAKLEQRKKTLQSQTAEAKKQLEEISSLAREVRAFEFERRKIQEKIDAATDDAARESAVADLKLLTEGEKQTRYTQNQEALTVAKKKMEEINEGDNAVKEERKKIEKQIEEIKTNTSNRSWAFAKAKAKEGESSRVLTMRQKNLLGEVEQMEVFNKRGIVVPSDAITELVENFEKQFSQMTYEMTVASMRDSLKAMHAIRKAGGDVEEADKATLAGLFKHAFNNGWVDDAIPAIMGDNELKGMAEEAFGWKDSVFDIKKINEVQSLFATGLDTKFAKVHAVVGDMLDTATSELNMGIDEFFSKWKSGGFSQEEIAKFKANNANVDQVLAGSKVEVEKRVDDYLKTNEDNQAQLQLLGNLRDAAINGNHPENGGHSQYHDVGGGRGMYIMMGAKAARNYVYADVNKMEVGKRVRLHTHAVADIDEDDGIATNYRINDLRIIRNGVQNANDRRGTNVRYDNQASSIGAMEDRTEYIAKDGFKAASYNEDGTLSKDNTAIASGAFLVNGTKNDGRTSARLKNLKRRNAAQMTNASDDEQRYLTASDAVQHVFAPQLIANPRDFLMGMASQSGVDQNDALNSGKMNMVLAMKDSSGKVRDVHVNNINTLIGMYNRGAFGTPVRQVNRYIPPSGAAQRANKQETTEGSG